MAKASPENPIQEKTPMHQGSCLCGKVGYEYRGKIDEVSMCHCKQCQKAQGSAFVAVAPIRSADFRITRGAEHLKEYRATPGKVRVFCAECGSPLYSARDDLPEARRLRLGTLDTPIASTPGSPPGPSGSSSPTTCRSFPNPPADATPMTVAEPAWLLHAGPRCRRAMAPAGGHRASGSADDLDHRAGPAEAGS
jgi:hypothetical protein